MPETLWLPIEKIRLDPAFRTDRPLIDDREIEAARLNGIAPPVLVRPGKSAGEYLLVGDGRGWWIAQQAMIPEIPATVTNLDTEDASAFTHASNDPIQQARAWQRIYHQEQSIKTRGALTRAAAALGIGKATLHRHLRLLDLHPEVQDLLRSKAITPAVAGLLADKPRHEQPDWAHRLKNLSYRQAQQQLNRGSSKRPAAPASPVTPATGIEDIFDHSAEDHEIQRLEEQLGELVGSPVRIVTLEGRGGVLAIRYHNYEELDGLMERLGWRPEEDF